MKVYNCWCGKVSPLQFISKEENVLTWKCLMCNGAITVVLGFREVWEERSCNGE